MISWGLVSAGQAFAGDAWSFYALRCFLVAEAGSSRLSPSTWALASIGTASF
jgi:hypothetical protein